MQHFRITFERYRLLVSIFMRSVYWMYTFRTLICFTVDVLVDHMVEEEKCYPMTCSTLELPLKERLAFYTFMHSVYWVYICSCHLGGLMFQDTTDGLNTDMTTGPNPGPVTESFIASISTSGPKDSPDPTTRTRSRNVPETATITASTPEGSSITSDMKAAGMNATMTTTAPISKGTSPAVIAAVVIILLLAVVTIVLVVWFCKCRNRPCCKGHRVRARHGSNHESFTSDGGINGFGMSPVQAEMQPFIMRHRCDIFIHHHGTDLTLAEMMRSKLLDQESHLHVTLWSEIAGTGRESRPSTKRLALSLVHSTTIVLLVSWKYLQHESQRFRLALSRIPRKVDSVRGKVVIVRRIEEDKVPQDLKMDIAHSLEYNVDTDSKFFWPRFDRAVIPQRDDMLYWRS